MSGALKKLAGQTALYGLSSIVGRFLNYLLVPLYTYQFKETQDYGVVTEFYAYVSFLVVLLTYGMETAFFRFSNKSEEKSRVLSTALIALLSTSLVFVVFGFRYDQNIADLILHPDHTNYVRWFVLILAFDALSAIPMAQLRQEEKALQFALINLASIGVNLGINFFFIWYCKGRYGTADSNALVDALYDPSLGVGYIFLANLAGSAIKMFFLIPVFKYVKAGFDWLLFKGMLKYAYPIMFASLAGIVNETIDRIMLKFMLIEQGGENYALAQVGVYGACYKVAMLVTIFLQAYRYAAEPFFFKQSQSSDAKETYAKVFFYFVTFLTLIFVGIMTYIDVVMLFVGETYREGVVVVPILLIANIFLGVIYNLSIWYKLTDQTHFGLILGVGGALITVLLNWLLIPQYGYVGSAYATLACYATIAVASYVLGQKYYPVNYQLGKVLVVVIPAVVLVVLMPYIATGNVWADYGLKTLLLTIYLLGLYRRFFRGLLAA